MTKDNSEKFEDWWGQNSSGQYARIERIIAKQAWDHQQKKIDELEEQLRGERQATKTFSEHLNNERVRHGSTEKKLQAAEEKLKEKQLTIDAIYNIDTKFYNDDDEYSFYAPNDNDMLKAIFELIEEREPKWRKE